MTTRSIRHGGAVRCRVATTVVLVTAMSMVLGGCVWTQFGWGPEHASSNPFERVIGVSNVAQLHEVWRASAGTTSSPTVANGVVYIGSPDQKLYAFRAADNNINCSGSPKTCTPLWTATTGGQIAFSSPAIANGVVYIGSLDHKLYAFDAAGKTNCSGSPRTCAPLWTAVTDGGVYSSPAVSGGVVYVESSAGTLYAYDAQGAVNCSGSPKTCSPLWTAAPGPAETTASPAVANGRVYVASADQRLHAFDAAGNLSCSGDPKTCSQLWSGAVVGDPTSPVIGNGMVYVGTFGDNDPHVLAFDAAGAEQCSGVPATCEPLWTAPTGDPILSMLATANGIVYAASEFGRVLAFDAGGTINCSGSPTSCTPLWSGQFSGRADFTALAIANGVLYIGAETGPDAPSGDDHGAVLAFDANGVTGCSGTPTNCNPLVELPTDRYINGGSPAVVNGRVYVGDTGGKLYAYALPSA